MQILIVEDQPRVAALIAKGLRAAGYSTIVARDGDEGMRLALEGQATRPSAEALYSVGKALDISAADLLGKPPETAVEKIAVPRELRQVAKEFGLPDEDVKMLASIRYRSEQPKTEAGWRFLYESIRRSVKE